MSNTSAQYQPVRVCCEHGTHISRACLQCAERRAKVKLRDALWELAHLSDDELRAYVEDVLAEIRSDEP